MKLAWLAVATLDTHDEQLALAAVRAHAPAVSFEPNLAALGRTLQTLRAQRAHLAELGIRRARTERAQQDGMADRYGTS